MRPICTVVASADDELRRAAADVFEGLGCDVPPSDGAHGLGRFRVPRPDLLVLVPPLAGGSVPEVLAALGAQPPMFRVPVLVLAATLGDGPFPRVPRLFLNGRDHCPDGLPGVVERASAAWSRVPVLRTCGSGPERRSAARMCGGTKL